MWFTHIIKVHFIIARTSRPVKRIILWLFWEHNIYNLIDYEEFTHELHQPLFMLGFITESLGI